jgi:hypothetical protein
MKTFVGKVGAGKPTVMLDGPGSVRGAALDDWGEKKGVCKSCGAKTGVIESAAHKPFYRDHNAPGTKKRCGMSLKPVDGSSGKYKKATDAVEPVPVGDEVKVEYHFAEKPKKPAPILSVAEPKDREKMRTVQPFGTKGKDDEVEPVGDSTENKEHPDEYRKDAEVEPVGDHVSLRGTVVKDAKQLKVIKSCPAENETKNRSGVIPVGASLTMLEQTDKGILVKYQGDIWHIDFYDDKKCIAQDASPFDRDSDAGAAKIVLCEKASGAEAIAKKYGFSLSFVKDVLAGKLKSEHLK